MKATVKLTFVVAVMTTTASVNAWAQVADRFVDEQPPPAKPAQPLPTKAPKEPPPLFIVNDNIVGYYYLPTATNPGAGQTPKNVAFFQHFDVWTYGTNFFSVEYLKATNGRVPPFGTPAAPCDQGPPLLLPGRRSARVIRRSTGSPAARLVGISSRARRLFQSVR